MKKLFIVNGRPKAGKTEFEKLVSKYIPTYITSTITEVVAVVDDLHGKSEKNEIRRKLLSDIKQEFVKTNIITLITEIKVNEFYKSDKKIMFLDSREIKEIELFKYVFDFETIFIKNDRVPKVISNSSDANVENMKYDYIIDNNGTLAELEKKAKDFVLYLIKNQ